MSFDLFLSPSGHRLINLTVQSGLVSDEVGAIQVDHARRRRGVIVCSSFGRELWAAALLRRCAAFDLFGPCKYSPS